MNDPEIDGQEIERAAITPIAPPEHLRAEIPAETGDFFSKCVLVLSVVLAITALIASAIGFAGFAENDQNFTHLLSAFALCFGIGALAYVPLSIIAVYARKAVWRPLPKIRAIIVLLLILPWLFLCYYLYQLGGQMAYGAVIIALSGLFIAAWSLRFLKAK